MTLEEMQRCFAGAQEWFVTPPGQEFLAYLESTLFVWQSQPFPDGRSAFVSRRLLSIADPNNALVVGGRADVILFLRDIAERGASLIELRR